MQKSFVTAVPDTGSGDKTVTVSVTKNTGDARSVDLGVNGGV